MELFAEGKVDALLGFPPEPQELRARNIGRMILNTTTDKPWSHYFCCMALGTGTSSSSSDRYKRFLRALLKANDICATEPELAAQACRSRFAPRYDYAMQTLSELPYDRWREYDAEDTMRFFALRLNEVGMIESSPNRLITEGTDWRFLTSSSAS